MIVDQSTSKDPTFQTAQPLDGGTRKAYQRPRILSREPLEAMASTCSPGKGGPPCQVIRS
jgi:hypothetical protein